MLIYPDAADEIKRKLRSLKKLEIKIRFGGPFHASNFDGYSSKGQAKMQLVWDEFFYIDGGLHGKARYSLKDIVSLTKEEYKSIVDEYFFNVYYRYYSENGITGSHLFDPEILKRIGLLPDAGMEDIKKKFRELAKKYHPDTGGDESKFIELMDNYKKLVE